MPRQKRLLVTAGPTREMLDPVRFLSNLSTGEMGYEVARAARRRGYLVTLVSGPTAIPAPQSIRFIPVVSARDMKAVCDREFPKHDALVMTAAVCDFTAVTYQSQKIHRTRTKRILLKQTPDIVAGLARKKGKRTIIGFCLETEDWIKRGRAKLRRKGLDGIVANFYGKGHVPFGRRKITVALVAKAGPPVLLKNYSKPRMALSLLGWLESFDKNRFRKRQK